MFRAFIKQTNSLEFGYDDDGIRFYKVVNGNRTDFLIDSNQTYQQVLQERDHLTGTLLAYYTYGHDLLELDRPGIGTGYYHYDAQLSTRFLTDPTANIVNTYEYSASGPFLSHTTSLPNPFTYTGEYFDPESSLLYLRARYLNMDESRFLSRDMFPFQFRAPQSINRYVYCLDNGINCIDLSGNFSVSEMNAASAIAFTILVSAAGVAHAAFTMLTFKNLPPQAFHGLPEAGAIGFQGSFNIGGGISKICHNPVCQAAGIALSMTEGFGGIEILLPYPWFRDVWIYSYGRFGINLLGIKDYVDLTLGVDVRIYGGYIWDVEKAEKYTKSFFCTGLGGLLGFKSRIVGLLSKFGKIGPGITICSGRPEKPGERPAHGFYFGIGLAGKTPFQSPLAVGSSWSYYALIFKRRSNDRPQLPMRIEGLMQYWWWPLQLK